MINQNYSFHILALQIKAVIIKTFNFKFKNLSFPKLPENILIRHVINNKFIIILK